MDHAAHTPSGTTRAEGPSSAAGDLSGTRLGDFHVLRRLGQGGMGQVYLAEQLSLKRRVALKILRADLAANAVSLHRFKAEAEAVARATHANIVQVYATGEAAGLYYMALEYVHGRNLSEYLAKKGPPGVRLALSIMTQVAAALQRAGELGIIHRDIKPENILLTRQGEVKVADFGLSRCFAGDQQPLNLTQSGVTMGTPLYMSPEQVEGRPLDPRTDIYSFGVTCYHMLAGQPPFRGDNAIEVALKHVRAEPEPLAEVRPDLPAELCAVVHKMMAKDPAERYPTCRELLKDLARVQRLLDGSRASETDLPLMPPAPTADTLTAGDYLALSAEEEPPPPLPPTGRARARKRRRRLRAVLALGVLLAFAGGAALAWQRTRSPQVQGTAPEPSAGEGGDSAVEAIFSDKKREESLRQTINQFANPGEDRSQVDLGLRLCLELGLLYLKDQPPRLEEADRFFRQLVDNPYHVAAYTVLGKLGHAIVLAYQDRPAESDQLFLEVLQEAGPGKEHLERARFLVNNPKLRYWIAQALERNAVNLEAEKQSLPEKLKPLREPPIPRFPPRRPAQKADTRTR